MSILLTPLRRLAIRQGERTIGALDSPTLPEGPPHGLVAAPARTAGRRVSLAVVGDGGALGVGVHAQAESFPALVARALAERTAQEVVWQAVGEPETSVTGLHNRVVPQLPTQLDFAVVQVGMNDLLARTSRNEWRVELGASLALLTRKARTVVVCGCPPLRPAPLLPWPLSAMVDDDAKALDEVSHDLCASRGIAFVEQRQSAWSGDYAPDGLHLGVSGQARIAGLVADAL